MIQTVLKGFPLNVMYWVKASPDSYEGAGRPAGGPIRHAVFEACRTLSPWMGKKYYWDALPDDSYDAIMNYELMVYICEGKSRKSWSGFGSSILPEQS